MRDNEKKLVLNLRSLGLRYAAQGVSDSIDNPQFQGEGPIDMAVRATSAEFDKRACDRADRPLKQSRLYHAYADVSLLEYGPHRTLDKVSLERLAKCTFIEDHMNVCTFGPSGTDKTFITKAIAVEACRKGYRTKEIHCLSFISELLTLYRTDRTRYGKKQKYYSRIPVLLIDGWFVCMPKVDETTILFDLVERRYGNTSTVISFQMPPTNWAKACGNEAMGKSVVGRLLNASFPTDLTRSADMRNTHSQPAGQATSPHQNIHPPLSARC